MARLALVIAAIALLGAQALPRLHVLALGQHPDRTSVGVHEPFHVTIRLKVSEKRDRFDELILGDCLNCSIVGDERIPRPVPGGTEYLERLTIEATGPGVAILSPAHIDAIDPVSGKALRYSTDPVRVKVGEVLIEPGKSAADIAMELVHNAALTVGVLAVVIYLIVLTVALLRRRRERAEEAGAKRDAEPAVQAAGPYEPSAPTDPIVHAADLLRGSRSETDLVALRGLLFDEAGAGPGATMIDALRGVAPHERDLRAALLASERAMFGPVAERDAAIDDLLAAIEAYSRRPAANGT